MLSQERYGLILGLLSHRRTVTVAELTQELGVSEATVRRDLKALHELGQLQKIHGGAIALSSHYIAQREESVLPSHHSAKNLAPLGQYAAALIQDDDFVYIDAGSTTAYLVDALERSQATFITNSFAHAQKLGRKGLRTYILGGKFNSATQSVEGGGASKNLQQYHFTKCFLGAGGISQEAGFTAPHAEDAMLKSEAVERSQTVYILAHHSKFNTVAPVTFAPLDGACIITDHLPDERYRPLTVIKEVVNA